MINPPQATFSFAATLFTIMPVERGDAQDERFFENRQQNQECPLFFVALLQARAFVGFAHTAGPRPTIDLTNFCARLLAGISSQTLAFVAKAE
jgi:hypothetical protein